MSVFRRHRLSLASLARLRVLPRLAWVLALLLVFSNVTAFTAVTLSVGSAMHAGTSHCGSMSEHKAACHCCAQTDCGCTTAASPLPAFPAALGIAWISPAAPIFPAQSDAIPAGTSAPPLRPPIA